MNVLSNLVIDLFEGLRYFPDTAIVDVFGKKMFVKPNVWV